VAVVSDDDERMLPFMFLGGPLDHTTRMLRCEGPLMTPPEVIKAPVRRSAVDRMVFPDGPEPAPTLRYRRHRVTTSMESWWVMVLDGYSPPRTHLLDACPFVTL
jgi:hypothetical protein